MFLYAKDMHMLFINWFSYVHYIMCTFLADRSMDVLCLYRDKRDAHTNIIYVQIHAKKTKQQLIVENISTTKNSISFNVIEHAFYKFSTLILVITVNLHIRVRKLVRKENLLEMFQEIRAKERLDMVN